MSADSRPTRDLLLVLLSLAAGCVDALAFLHAGVFPANMTGNTVVLATSLLHPTMETTVLSLVALAGFCLGAAGSAWSVHSCTREWSAAIDRALVAAGLLVAVSTLLIVVFGSRFLPLTIALVSIAMGAQSAAVQQLGISGVATVFMTGTLTNAMGQLTGAIRARWEGKAADDVRWLPLLTWAAYFTGAFVGSLQHFLHSNLPFLLPSALFLAVPLLSRWKLRKPPATA